jgi:subtilisin family serine protease
MRKLRVAAATLLLLACHEPTDPNRPGPNHQLGSTEAKRWVVVFNQPNGLPKNVEGVVAKAGGAITAKIAEIGAIGASSSDPGFAAKVAADPQVKAVSEDIEVQMIPAAGSVEDPVITAQESPGPAEPPGPDPQPGPEPLYNQQWDKMRMNASLTGSYAVQRGRRDVVVAILDTGAEVLPAAHPDIAPNLDFAQSRSFVVPVGSPPGPAEGDPNPAAWDDKHGHGSWCASAVAAPINAFGISGVAPEVTLVALKVLRDNGSGSFFWVAQALVYAGVHRFNVASMSLGGYIPHAGGQALITVVQRAVEFARSKGVLPIAALANDNFDISDGEFMRSFIVAPAEIAGVVGVSATGYTNRKAFYSNYGVGKTDVSAPGGGSTTFEAMPPTYHGNGRVLGAWSQENLGGVTPVFFWEECAPGPGGACVYYAWVRGTSMATPNAAGVAALIFSQYGLDLSPTHVESVLQQTANNQPCTDNTEPIYVQFELVANCSGTAGGYTDFFGKGIVDALKAVTR